MLLVIFVCDNRMAKYTIFVLATNRMEQLFTLPVPRQDGDYLQAVWGGPVLLYPVRHQHAPLRGTQQQ